MGSFPRLTTASPHRKRPSQASSGPRGLRGHGRASPNPVWLRQLQLDHMTERDRFRTLSARRIGGVAFWLEKIPGVRHFFDRRFDDYGQLLVNRPTKGLRESLRSLSASRRRPKALSEAYEIWIREIGRNDALCTHVLL